MTIVLSAVDLSSVGPTLCSDLVTVTAEDAQRFGCPVKTKTRTVIISTGHAATVHWEMRDAAGAAIDLTSCDEAEVEVRIMDVLGRCYSGVKTVTGDILDADSGIVSFTPPSEIYSQPGIYRFDIAIKVDDVVRFVNNGWLSVENNLFSAAAYEQGPPTLGDIRIQLRDIWVENNLRGEVEFSDAEIMHSLIQPVRYWNEIPPDIVRYTTANFPYRYHWLMATVANLLLVSAQWYMRNKAGIQAGGASINDMDKDQPYAALALRLREEYQQFVRDKKIEINISQGWGSMP